MIQKLTANLKQSQQYGQKIASEIAQIGDEIVKTRIQISNMEQQLNQRMKEQDHVDISLRRQSEEQTGYQYKFQKLEIRLKEYNRKLVLQQEIHTKKIGQQQSLKNKIKRIQQDIIMKDVMNNQISRLQAQIQDNDVTINRQAITMQNLYLQLISNNKMVRNKQDELQLVKKSNLKKMQSLRYLDEQMKGAQNKQNEIGNLAEQRKLTNLAIEKERTSQKCLRQMHKVIQVVDKIDEVLQIGVNIKKQINKQWDIAQEVKNHKQSLLKIKQMLEEVKKNE